MSGCEYQIAVMIPTRNRTVPLKLCLESLINNASDVNSIQILLGFDNDDQSGFDYFVQEVEPWLKEKDVNYIVMKFERMGYANINRYYNTLAEHSDSDWLMGWSDDAAMETIGWDKIITSHTGEFKLLKVHTHNEHPYSIFPIWPREWYNLFGHVSRHQMVDAEISQIGYMVNRVVVVDIYVTHNRPDLTGEHEDETHTNRVLLEGNQSNPLDLHHFSFVNGRYQDAGTVAEYLKSKGEDVSFWENVKAGKQDPWEILKLNDINNHTTQIKVLYE